LLYLISVSNLYVAPFNYCREWHIIFSLVWSCSWQFQWYQYGNYLINGGDNTNIKCSVGCTSYLVIGVKNCKLSSGMLTFNAIDVYRHLKGLEECICPDDRGNRFLWNVDTPTRCHIPGDINFVSRLSDIWWIKIYQANKLLLLQCCRSKKCPPPSKFMVFWDWGSCDSEGLNSEPII